jgi:hypothetical protein
MQLAQKSLNSVVPGSWKGPRKSKLLSMCFISCSSALRRTWLAKICRQAGQAGW